MKATYKKLRDESWGIHVTDGAPTKGQTVTVTKKDGSTKTETIKVVLWSGNGVALCAIEQRSTGCSCDSNCCQPRCQCDQTCNCQGGNIYGC